MSGVAVAEEPVVEVTVQKQHEPGVEGVSRVEGPPRASLGEVLAETPGVWVVRRGGAGSEPSIRGLGWERVATQVGPLQLYGACPGRMDPPVSYLGSTLAPRLEIAYGIPSVTLGPGGTAGRIVAETDTGYSPFGATGWLEAGFDGARRGAFGGGSVAVGNEVVDARVGLEGLDGADYRDGDGRRVPAEQTEYGGALTVAVSPTVGHRAWHTIGYQRHQDVDYPALPMDLVSTDGWIYDGGYRVHVDDPVLHASEVRIALASLDHVMDNAHKSNRPLLEARSESEVLALGARGAFEWGLGPVRLDSGADLSFVRRDGVRARLLPASGQRFRDHLWPDARQWDLGLFTEARVEPRDRLAFRVGGRLDHVQSSLGGARDPSLGGLSVRDQFLRLDGPGAGEVDDAEVVGAANAIVEWRFDARSATHLGFGTSMRAAGITERYLAYAPAPGGFQVGNPALVPEQKFALEWGGRLGRSWLDLETRVYAHWFADFIAQRVLLREDVNADGVTDVVRGFRNVDARLLGGEAEATPRLTPHLSLPTTLALVYGADTTHGTPLAEIPPWELTSGLRVEFAGSAPWWALVGVRAVGAQDRVDREFGEDPTPGFATVHARAGVRLLDRLLLQAGVENVLDTTYHEHLTREVALDAGELAAGDEISAPGRYVALRARVDL